MNIKNVKERAFAMPLTNPSYPKGPYEFRNREYFIVTYRTDPIALANILPEPLIAPEPLVMYEFIKNQGRLFQFNTMARLGHMCILCI
jgi:acetoacetate decarboxylase